MRWGKSGEVIGTKSRGASRHVSAYCTECVGVLDESMEWLDPGGDMWWTGKKFKAQVPRALGEYDRKKVTLTYASVGAASVIYDNSSKRQQDFLSQKTVIEEVFDKYNAEHGTKHRCIFLPKFHPELNYIERICL